MHNNIYPKSQTYQPLKPKIAFTSSIIKNVYQFKNHNIILNYCKIWILTKPTKWKLTRVLSRVATRMNFPLGENLTKDTAGFLSSMRVFKQVPEEASQILQEPSWLPETINEPSLLKCTDVTGIEWALMTLTHFPVFTSQIRIVSSKEPETIKFDWGLKFTQNTKSEWPLRILRQSKGVRASQMRRVRSSEAEQI